MNIHNHHIHGDHRLIQIIGLNAAVYPKIISGELSVNTRFAAYHTNPLWFNMAMDNEDIDLLATCLEKKPDLFMCERNLPYSSVFHLAAETNAHENLNLLINYASESKITKEQILSWPNSFGQTPLYCAAIRLATDCVKLLLELGANPNIADHETGITALQKACMLYPYPKAEETIRLLLHHGANPNYKLDNRPSALDYVTAMKLCKIKAIFKEFEQKETEEPPFDSYFSRIPDPREDLITCTPLSNTILPKKRGLASFNILKKTLT